MTSWTALEHILANNACLGVFLLELSVSGNATRVSCTLADFDKLRFSCWVSRCEEAGEREGLARLRGC